MAEPVDWEWYQNKAFMNRLGATLSPAQIKGSDYCCIYYAGGHRVLWDFPDNPDLQKLAREIYESGGIGLVRLPRRGRPVENQTRRRHAARERQARDRLSRMRFCLYVHHTDAEREWAYDRKSHIGKLDKGLDEATARGWTVVSMKDDWKTIYP